MYTEEQRNKKGFRCISGLYLGVLHFEVLWSKKDGICLS